MTISNSTRAAGPFIGNGSAASFPFSFKVFSGSDVVVVRANSDAQATLTLGADYTIQLNLDQDSNPGGSVTLNVPLDVGYSLVVTSNLAELQGTSLTNQGGFYPKVIEAAFDRVTILIQQLRTIANRSLRFPLSDTGTNTELPSKSRRANNLLGFDANGNPVAIAPVAQSANALQAALATPGGSGMLGFVQAGVGAILRTLQDKARESISVADYLQSTDPDDSLSFQRAIDALPALGGKIRVPGKAYVLATQPSYGTKSVHWEFDVAATFSGAGTGQNKFPSMVTNGGQMPVGPYIRSQSRNGYVLNNGGIAAYNIEMIQPVDVDCQSVAVFIGARGSNPSTTANVWCINPVLHVDAGAGGTYQGVEMDVDVFSDAALVKGFSLNGVGSANPDVGIELIRSDATRWTVGVDIMHAITGLQIRNTTGLTTGLRVGDPSLQTSMSVGAKQLSNGGDALVLQRNTDTNPLGYLLRVIDAANSTSLLTIDVAGNLTTAGIVQGNHLVAKGGATAKPAGSFAFGSTNQQTVGPAGTAAALPANPRGYAIFYDGATKCCFPYYVAQ